MRACRSKLSLIKRRSTAHPEPHTPAALNDRLRSGEEAAKCFGGPASCATTLLVLLPAPARARLVAAYFLLFNNWLLLLNGRLEAGPRLNLPNRIFNQPVPVVLKPAQDFFPAERQVLVDKAQIDDPLINQVFLEGLLYLRIDLLRV